MAIIFLSKKWHFDQLANSFIVSRSLNFGYHVTFRLFDKGIIETFGPVGLVFNAFQTAQKTSAMQTGYIYNQFITVITMSLLLAIFVGLSTLGFLPYNENFILLALTYGAIVTTML